MSRLNSPFVSSTDRAVERLQPAQADVQLPAAEAVAAHACDGVGHRGLRAGAAQQGAHARQQLARAEGLGQVVVGAELQPHHAVGLFGAAGEHQDRQRRVLSRRRARDLHAVLAGQLEVEHEQVDGVARQGRVELAPAGQRRHAQVVLGQIFGSAVRAPRDRRRARRRAAANARRLAWKRLYRRDRRC